MSFPRHRRSIHPMWKQTGSRLDAHSRLSSARMSRNRLFLGGLVSTRARLRLAGCSQNAVQWSCRSSNLQRTANSVLFACLSRGVHPSRCLRPIDSPLIVWLNRNCGNRGDLCGVRAESLCKRDSHFLSGHCAKVGQMIMGTESAIGTKSCEGPRRCHHR